MVELKDRQQQEAEGRLQLPSHVMVMECMFTSLKVHNLKVHIQETYYIIKKGTDSSGTWLSALLSIKHRRAACPQVRLKA